MSKSLISFRTKSLSYNTKLAETAVAASAEFQGAAAVRVLVDARVASLPA